MEIEIFVQGDELPEIKLVRVPQSGTVRDVVEAARKEGLPSPLTILTPLFC